LSNKIITMFSFEPYIFVVERRILNVKYLNIIQMKKIFLCICFVVAGLQPLLLNAQFRRIDSNETIKKEPIDEVQFIVQYQTKMITDTLNPEKVTDESMILKVGAKSSVYYSYTGYVADSIIRREQTPININGGQIWLNTQGINFGIIKYQIYKNYPTGKVTTLDFIGANHFRCEEENEIPSWQLMNDTMTILSYSCQKAVCHFKGRDYEAWFTPEIPRSEGPWKLHGLPGLILKAADSQAHYTFECTGLINKNEELLFGANGYEPISRKNLNKINERFATDPIGFSTSSMPTNTNIKVTYVNESGNAVNSVKFPYNPIERDEE